MTDEHFKRVELMATGNPTWDLSDNDLDALQAVVDHVRELTAQLRARDAACAATLAELERLRGELAAIRDVVDDDSDKSTLEMAAGWMKECAELSTFAEKCMTERDTARAELEQAHAEILNRDNACASFDAEVRGLRSNIHGLHKQRRELEQQLAAAEVNLNLARAGMPGLGVVEFDSEQTQQLRERIYKLEAVATAADKINLADDDNTLRLQVHAVRDALDALDALDAAEKEPG